MSMQSQAILYPPSSAAPAQQATVTMNAVLALARRELARQWLKLPASELEALYTQLFGNLQRTLRAGNLRDTPLLDPDRELVADIVKGLQAADPSRPDLGRLLAAMLYLEPHELPVVVSFAHIPPWLLDDYGTYMMTPPDLFRQPGEAEAYGRHMQRWVACLHTGILGNPRNEGWTKIGSYVVQKLNLVSIYFNQLNLCETYRQRAQIFEFMLSAGGHRIDWSFAPRQGRSRIRLGILAAHFAPQTETFATLPIYEHLDRTKFEIILFTCKLTSSPLERHCKSKADRFEALPEGLPNQVAAMRQANLDMLLVATNVTAVTNAITLLAMHRLARVQISLVPSCTTSGMRHMDCYLSGSLSEPPEKAQEHYSERLFMVDGPAHCYDFATEQAPQDTQVLTREMLRIPSEAVVFVSGANFYKLIPEVQDLWMRILAATPGSCLLLYPFNPNWSNNYPVEKFINRFRAAGRVHGVSADRLVVLAPGPTRNDVLTRLRLADIYLDSFPFSGATSLLDPFEAGLPTVVMDGNPFRARVGPALLRTMNMEELIAQDVEAYFEIACRLAADAPQRGRVSAQIQAAMLARPKFLDTHWYAGEVTRILTDIWKEHNAAVPRGAVRHGLGVEEC